MPSQVLIPGWPWSVSDGQLYWGNFHVRRANLATFEPIGKYWGRDSARVYSAGSEIREVDRDGFRVLNELYAKDSRKAFTMMGPITEADAPTFEAIGPVAHAFNTENGHAKDIKNVYHTTLGGKACLLKGADCATFLPRGNGYGSDTTSVYFERRKIPGADPRAWQFLRGPHSHAGKNAYIVGRRIRGADGRRFESLPQIHGIGDYWCRDTNGYYRGDAAGEPRHYLDTFRNCFIFTGKVSGVSVRCDRDYGYRKLESPDDFEIAEHVWIDVNCSRILQRPELEVDLEPRVGEPFRFGDGFHLRLLSPPAWMDEERIWIMVPSNNPSRVGTLTLFVSRNWWEYSPLSEMETVLSLIAAAKAA